MKSLLTLLRNANTSPRVFLVPLFWCVAVSFLDGISVGMFIPILKGAIEGDFSFLNEIKYIGPVIASIPYLNTEFGVLRPLSFLAALMITLFIAKLMVTYIANVSTARASYYMAHRLRITSFERCIGLGKGFFDSSKSGQLHTIITQFSMVLSWRLTSVFSSIARILPIVFYMALLFFISWRAALLTVLLSPLVLVIKPVYAKLHRLSRADADNSREVSNHLDRVFQGITTVKANSGEQFELQKFIKTSLDAQQSGTHLVKRQELSNAAFRIMLLASFAVCGASLLLLLSDDIRSNMSNYLIYIVILRRTVDVMQQGATVYGEMKSLSGVVDSINGLFAESLNKYELKDGVVPFEGISDEIRVRNLHFSYLTGLEVLHDVNLTIRRGEVVALVGPSGSGKSTIAQLLLRLYDSPPGTIFFDDVDLRDFTLQTLRERTAYVSQTSNLFDDTIRNNLTYGLSEKPADAEIIEALSQARLEKFYSKLPEGLDTRIGDRGVRISGGEAQRIAIARAILKRVDFFILDEATSALDASTEQEVQAAIDALVHDKTVLIIAHRFSTLKNVDRIITISDGRVIEDGSLQELLDRQGMFAELWKAQELFV